MKISEFYAKNKRTFSFEFFPPKNEIGEKKLFETIVTLKSLAPSFVSVTYGAMGSTRENTLRIVSKIQNEIGIEAAAHLTCVAHSRDEIEVILEELRRLHVENIVALRGDIPAGETEFKPVPNGFRYASDLVRFIRNHPKYQKAFAIGVAGSPEGHKECQDKGKDLEHLKIKVDAGADVIITQLFFDNRDYYDFVERARKIGIQIPIVPGIMPVTHGPQIQKFAGMCGAKIPADLQEAILRFGDDQVAVESYGIDYATRQCEALLKWGAPGLHFYTLNKSAATRRIYSNLGLAKLR
ncbi:MAG: methylenetetrahydrofolate reductase [NAD(P)H] [Candidatus Omnitrophica bacterium]|nr:methylenetetrahydrofolate reductase [NAD(P)H] [Candidatus Omnitrophota bacterium]